MSLNPRRDFRAERSRALSLSRRRNFMRVSLSRNFLSLSPN